MSENLNRGISKYSKYDSMSTEELEEILRLDAEAPEGAESDTELLFYVMGVLAERRKTTQFTGKTALEAYESFEHNYLPVGDELVVTEPVTGKQKRKHHLWVKRLTAAAAVLVFILVGTITANALGINVWKVVATWAQETFHLSREGRNIADVADPTECIPYNSLADALLQNKVDLSLVPTWIPERYEFTEININENPARRKYVAIYTNDETYLKISVQSYQELYIEQIEQSDGYIETYETADVKYYIFQDNLCLQAVWIIDSYECYISGELTLDEIKMMIDSIAKG